MKKRKISNIINVGELFILIAIFLSLTIYIQFSTKYFAGYDSYYHVGVSCLISEGGPLQEFPWLQFTILKDNFVDDHFLFHLYLIPFIKIFDTLNGPKIAIILTQILVIAVFYFLLRKNRIELPVMWTFVFITFPSAFWWRLNLIRAEGFLLFMLIVFILLLFKRDNLWLLSVWSFLYVWAAVTSCIYLIIFVLLYSLSQKLTGKQVEKKKIMFVFLGLGAGLIINPYFPQNILFVYHQIIIAGLIRKVSYAIELQPYNTWTFLMICFVPFTLWCLGIINSFLKRKHDEKSLFLVLLSIIFLILVFKHQRFITYYPAFTLLASCFMLQDFIMKAKNYLKKYVKVSISVVLIVLFTCLGGISVWQASNWTQPVFNIKNLQASLNYIKRNSSYGDIVFHDDWDKFPYLFFFDHKNYYITGMDPSFMEQYSKKLFKKYNCLVTNDKYFYLYNKKINCNKFSIEAIKTDFKAEWVLVGSTHFRLNKLLNNAKKDFDLVYSNQKYRVYKVE